MTAICNQFDAYFDRWGAQIGALCFLLCRDKAGADYAAFQSLLRLGGAKNKDIPALSSRDIFLSKKPSGAGAPKAPLSGELSCGQHD